VRGDRSGSFPLLSPILVEDGLDGCPVRIAVCRVPPACRDDTTKRYATGWGATPEEALRRCWFEGAERYSAQWFGTEATIPRSAAEVGAAAVLPREILLVSEQQYRSRQEWNRKFPGNNDIPTRCAVEQTQEWILPAPVLSTSKRWLPAELSFLGYGANSPGGLSADSSGVAAGSSATDAAVRAFLELVERDAVAIWWYNRLRRPWVDPALLCEPLVAAYEEWAHGRRRTLRLLDLTHDLGIPVVAALSCSAVNGGELALGFGVAPSIAAAARHAVGELAQFEINVAFIRERHNTQGAAGVAPEATSLLHWVATASVEDFPFLKASSGSPIIPISARVSLMTCHDLCARKGLEFLALELTRASCGVPVVRVFVPGLRPKWARLAAGRLYDVPVLMGWLPKPLLEAELNTIPLVA
jgi:thiazole/oxazole-forming peptide maturase SagD family component